MRRAVLLHVYAIAKKVIKEELSLMQSGYFSRMHGAPLYLQPISMKAGTFAKAVTNQYIGPS
jgi:hypothetical protein